MCTCDEATTSRNDDGARSRGFATPRPDPPPCCPFVSLFNNCAFRKRVCWLVACLYACACAPATVLFISSLANQRQISLIFNELIYSIFAVMHIELLTKAMGFGDLAQKSVNIRLRAAQKSRLCRRNKRMHLHPLVKPLKSPPVHAFPRSFSDFFSAFARAKVVGAFKDIYTICTCSLRMCLYACALAFVAKIMPK